jgi:hypothetical protein
MCEKTITQHFCDRDVSWIGMGVALYFIAAYTEFAAGPPPSLIVMVWIMSTMLLVITFAYWLKSVIRLESEGF